MDRELFEALKKITPEEQRILDGSRTVERQLYITEIEKESQGSESSVRKSKEGESLGSADKFVNRIEAKKLLDEGKLIQVRKHTRFVHFPEHIHDFVEMVYIYSGSSRQKVNGKEILLEKGDLLILGQNTTQEIYPSGEEDIAINFIVLPEFFDSTLKMMENEPNSLRNFMIECLRGTKGNAGYMHFRVADILPVQNLLENLIWTIYHKQTNKRSTNQITMGLLFLQLMNYMDKMETNEDSETQLVMSVLHYIEEHYKDGALTELAQQLHYDIYWLSREIKNRTGKTYTDLVQQKRLLQAAFLLKTTAMSVLDIGMAVGYDNQSYFHRIFQKEYGMTPRKYRIQSRSEEAF